MARYKKKSFNRNKFIIITVLSLIVIFSLIAAIINIEGNNDNSPTKEITEEATKEVSQEETITTEETKEETKEETEEEPKEEEPQIEESKKPDENQNNTSQKEENDTPLNVSKYGFSDEYFTVSELLELKDSKYLMIANYENSIDEYAPKSLSTLQGYKIDSDIKEPLKEFIDDVNSKDLGNLIICSGYRTYEYQKGLFERRIKRCQNEEGLSYEKAVKKAATIVARPGMSEHQTGLTVDMMDSVANQKYGLSKEFAETKMYKYMKENAHKYGFIERYPVDKGDITKIIFEPWHYRYVGEKNARIMYEKGMCLEEYLSWIDYEIERRS